MLCQASRLILLHILYGRFWKKLLILIEALGRRPNTTSFLTCVAGGWSQDSGFWNKMRVFLTCPIRVRRINSEYPHHINNSSCIVNYYWVTAGSSQSVHPLCLCSTTYVSWSKACGSSRLSIVLFEPLVPDKQPMVTSAVVHWQTRKQRNN